MRIRRSVFFAALIMSCILCMGEVYAQQTGLSQTGLSKHENAKGAGGEHSALSAVAGDPVACQDGSAAGFDCRNIDLLSFLPVESLGGGNGTELNDIWGWTDQQSGREYALVGRSDGTAFVDITDPVNPVVIGDLPSHDSTRSVWRDIKVLNDYAVVVADNPLGPDGMRLHGMQIFDLTRLRDVDHGAAPVAFDEDGLYDGFERAHNVAVNPETEFAYAVGTETCGGGLHMIDMKNPLEPTFAGCFAHQGSGRHGSGYTHDVQCVVYHGPDADYQGREICFGSNETHVSIVDVTEKDNPIPISLTSYPHVQYTHQSWLTSDQSYILLDDELDEYSSSDVVNTRTLIFDVIDLDDPQLATEYIGESTSIDHNQYVVGDRSFQANYTSGLRILDISNILNPVEVAFFDTYPADDNVSFNGAWSNYPFFESGVVVVSSINEGLFVLNPVDAAVAAPPGDELPEDFALLTAYPNPFSRLTTIGIQADRPQRIRIAVYDIRGREVATVFEGDIETAARREFTFNARGLGSGVYLVRATGESASGSITVTLQK